jgi:hypothetical protein
MHGKWTKENFDEYHKENPEIYTMFEEYALKAAKHRKRYSAKIIFHIMRWDTMIGGRGSDYKIDDGWISHYSRLFMENHPELGNFFELRVRKESYHK